MCNSGAGERSWLASVSLCIAQSPLAQIESVWTRVNYRENLSGPKLPRAQWSAAAFAELACDEAGLSCLLIKKVVVHAFLPSEYPSHALLTLPSWRNVIVRPWM